MSKLEEIQEAIETLPEPEYGRLRSWLSERDWVRWDARIERDSASGRLDFLEEEARRAKAEGTIRPL